jgi:hypothetical protein
VQGEEWPSLLRLMSEQWNLRHDTGDNGATNQLLDVHRRSCRRDQYHYCMRTAHLPSNTRLSSGILACQ